MDWKRYIGSDPAVLHGAVCLNGTRVPVSVVLDSLVADETPERILQQYASLKRDPRLQRRGAKGRVGGPSVIQAWRAVPRDLQGRESTDPS